MKTCCLCGKEIDGWGNNPWPLCDVDDYDSICCQECNDTKVIIARLLMTEQKTSKPEIGDDLVIFWLHDEPRAKDYALRHGVIESIDAIGQLHGTWGGLAVDPKVDNFCVFNTGEI